ncbi:BTAD domain-containing putative transcriptional regulator [Nonomuraea sp. NPDC052129]|uniref:AfsR/SARP family transcriptional regulator n=1 Tax=Nonomuraea sp. NPDC052129 TaxID=3154651 RepID=UPI003436E898
MTMDLRFAVLGPLRGWRGAEPLDLGRPQQQALLALLLLRQGRALSDEAIVEGLWGQAPPARPTHAMRILVSRLRPVLEPDGSPWKVLTTVSGGYALRLPPGALDAAVFEERLEAADKARAAGELSRSRDLLSEALALWSGVPLLGLPGPLAEAHRARLTERRLLALEQRLELDLELGRHHQLVAELTSLSDEFPLRERLRGLLMLALYRSGRQAEALAVHAGTRRLLADELGVDPGPELTALHQAILRADPALAAPVQASARTAPAQLPADVADFTGRQALVRELTGLLHEGASLVISSVSGIGGVGKTALAVHVAHLVRDRYPDGQLYVDLRGGEAAPQAPTAVLAAFLRALGVAGDTIPEDLEERAALYRTTLANLRMLVVLDNAADAAQVRPLLPGASASGVVITSRARLIGLNADRMIGLEALTTGEALELFTRIVGTARVAAERHAAEQVVAACACLPLAVRIAASRLAARPGWTIASLVARLADQRRRLAELRTGDLAMEATFSLGYGQLDVGQARAFRLLAVPDGDDFSVAAAAAVLDLDDWAAEDLCESLADAGLLEAPSPGRYRYHDLLKLYARGLPEPDRDAALHRLVDFYLATARNAQSLVEPDALSTARQLPTASPGLAFAGHPAVTGWLDAEVANLFHTTLQAASDPAVADLLYVLLYVARVHLRWEQIRQIAQAIAQASAERGDRRSHGLARTAVAAMLIYQRSLKEGVEEGTAALALGRAMGDPVIVVENLQVLGSAAMIQRDYEAAIGHLAEALTLHRELGDVAGVGAALGVMSRACLALGRHDEAVDLARQGVELVRETRRSRDLGTRLYDLGIVLHGVGRCDEAVETWADSLTRHRAAGDRLMEGGALFRLAECHLAAGLFDQARARAEEAVAVNVEIDAVWEQARALTTLGKALSQLGQEESGRARLREALEIFERLDVPEAEDVRALL